jgi:long-chain fatty acid transport protein
MKRLFLLLAALPASALAEDGNYRPYLIGGRAGGMGGAFTALSDDASGPFYNPAGIAFVKRSQLSLSGSLFGTFSETTKDALGDGRSFDSTDLQTFPIQTAGVYKLGSEPPETSPDALGISIFVPTSVSQSDRDYLGSEASSLATSFREDDVWLGLTYAHRFGRLAVGASGFVLFETASSALELNVVDPSSSAAFANINASSDETRFGLVAALGVRYDVTDELSLGASIYSPGIGIWSKRKFYIRFASGDVEGMPADSQIRHNEELHSSETLPARIQAGVAWSSGAVTLTADVIVLLPRQARDDEDLEGFSRWIKRNLVVNGAAGLEVLLTPSLPFRAGAWTDLSAADDPTPTGPNNNTQVDRIGASMSLAVRAEHTETSLNLNVAYAWGSSIIPDNFDFTTLKKTSEMQLGVYAIVASSFQF